MPEVRRTRAAARDLDEIWDDIASDNPQAADRLLDQIGDRCNAYARQPLMGSTAQEIDPVQSSLVRWFSVENYSVFYIPDRDGILVLRVLHGQRDIPQVLRDEPLHDDEAT